MKKIILPAVIGVVITGAVSCTKSFLDLKPIDTLTEADYYKTPDQFKAATNAFYEDMVSWQKIDNSNVFELMDFGSDISVGQPDLSPTYYGRGAVTVPVSDKYWDNPYSYIRNINTVLQKAAGYTGKQDDIKQYVAAAKFFRAWQYFFLLKRYGGVPIVLTPLDVESAELTAPRNSRYEVVNQILADLTDAIAGLPTEQAIPAADKGHVSRWAAEAFKARVLLYEATWRKYTGTSTDFQGAAGPAADEITSFLTQAYSLAKDVMLNGGYKLWNYNTTASLNNRSSYYLFNIDGSGANPAALDKTTNTEFILKNIYDLNLRPSGIPLTATVTGYMQPSRKMMDMYLCTDGLPVAKSSLFQGYGDVTKEYQNRDYRLLSYVLGNSAIPAVGSISLDGTSYGYTNKKFGAYNYPTYRKQTQESQDYPQIRLAEVYLIFAEALYEKNGSIGDADLNISINVLRARAGVSPLSNALIATYGLDMQQEIRRERTVELYGEPFRYDDLKRWGVAERELNQDVCGMVVGDAANPTEFVDATGNATAKYYRVRYNAGAEVAVATGKGNLKAIVADPASNRNFKRTHYLFPIPLKQTQLNPNLVQNNGY